MYILLEKVYLYVINHTERLSIEYIELMYKRLQIARKFRSPAEYKLLYMKFKSICKQAHELVDEDK